MGKLGRLGKPGLPPDILIKNHSDTLKTSATLAVRGVLLRVTKNTQAPNGSRVITAASLVPDEQSTKAVTTNTIVELLSSRSNAVPFVRFSAPILDRRVAEKMRPLLDNLPIIRLQGNVQTYCMSSSCRLPCLLIAFQLTHN